MCILFKPLTLSWLYAHLLCTHHMLETIFRSGFFFIFKTVVHRITFTFICFHLLSHISKSSTMVAVLCYLDHDVVDANS